MNRKTRLVCVSDTHAYTPSEAGFRLPAGDVLIHAGDLTNQGSLSELRKTVAWIAKAPYEVKIIIAGNHDLALDPRFSNHPEDTQQCMEAVANRNDPSIVYLCHESAEIRLTRADGPQTVFTVFGSPYTPFPSTPQNRSKWTAFGYEQQQQQNPDSLPDDSNCPTEEQNNRNSNNAGGVLLWDQIPLDTDILITHTPPYAHRDRHSRTADASDASGDQRTRPVGCPALRQALQRVRPKIAVCGHVHESRGCERLLWPPPPASSWRMTRDTDSQARYQVAAVELPPMGSKKQSLVNLTGKKQAHSHHHYNHNHHATPTATATTDITASSRSTNSCLATAQQPQQETCLVNAAILATSWPHPGGKRFHTPVVVDVDFPAAAAAAPAPAQSMTGPDQSV